MKRHTYKFGARRAAQARWAKEKELVGEITDGTKRLLQTARSPQARWAKSKKKTNPPQ